MSFMFRFLKPDDPYYPNWVHGRRRARLFWLVLALWPPSTFLVSAILRAFFGPNVAFVVAGLLTACIVLAFRVYQVAWPCPRCDRPFYWGLGYGSYCVHCRLPEYAPHGDY